ncbi:haloacid dehalogenase-like hydrolase [Paraconexibacter algicola]|uniref:Haloacid dehalogenase n=1 Tax=Paraconexibacter algicola TaxID=2133960 RepID=A0A2T4UHS3_9ACTN|nr:haloacid dehalogenase-like hydrolase [Paraconexibacter algicola]PTL58778.1 haloacid dehalogenase [Paraconexibacter algicola]
MLLLFDIDGTLLIDASAAHRDALHAAIREVHGVAIPRAGVDAAGRTDGAIAADIVRLAGVPDAAARAGAAAVREAACRHYERLCPDDLSAHVAAGVPELLAGLAERDDVLCTLVTGNHEPIARRKLAAAGIGHRFPAGQGGFGSDHDDRDRLPGIARLRAGRRACGRAYPAGETVVIGDTPRDIACARADGVHVVAVTTGAYDAEALAAADVVVDGAAALPGALRALGLDG